jgi:hypothetical protein
MKRTYARLVAASWAMARLASHPGELGTQRSAEPAAATLAEALEVWQPALRLVVGQGGTATLPSLGAAPTTRSGAEGWAECPSRASASVIVGARPKALPRVPRRDKAHVCFDFVNATAARVDEYF